MGLMNLNFLVLLIALVTLLVCQHTCNGRAIPNEYPTSDGGLLQRYKREPDFDPQWVAETARILGHKLDTEKYQKKLQSNPPRHRLTITEPEADPAEG